MARDNPYLFWRLGGSSGELTCLGFSGSLKLERMGPAHEGGADGSESGLVVRLRARCVCEGTGVEEPAGGR